MIRIRYAALAIAFGAATLAGACGSSSGQRTFGMPDDAVRALIAAAKTGEMDPLLEIFGPDGQDLIDSSDPVTARRNRLVFTAAASERWQLVDEGADKKVLVIGNEQWPFPVPLIKDGRSWRFDTAAGKEEILARRIGRNELAAIRASKTYVRAQQLYAVRGHDGKRAGLFAATFRSDPGRENGLYWAAVRGQKRSPLGDLLAEAADPQRLQQNANRPSPFHGYYFRILTAQGPAAPGGARDYMVNGELSGGFALVAWPARYDVTGIMTFLINHDGFVRERDLGPDTDAAIKAMSSYNPDGSWTQVQ